MRFEALTRTAARVTGIIVVLGMGAACAKKAADEQVSPAASAAAPSVASSPPSGTTTLTAASNTASPAMAATAALGLFERLAKEKSSRPSGTPRAEEVVAAMGKAGIPLSDESQVYGATVKATYCEAAKGTSVFVSICEYPDEAAAKEGRDYSSKTFAAVKNRQILVNKKTTLTIAQSTPTASGDADAKKMADVFSKL